MNAFSLRTLNTFGLNISAQNLIKLNNFLKIHKIFHSLHHQKFYILGGGSNVLFLQDYDGTIVLNRLKGIQILSEDSEEIHIRVASGENWHEFVMFTIENQWFGLENLALIPGTVGAAPMQNIGAYGVEVKDFISKVHFYHFPSQKFQSLSHEQCQFGYRESVFKYELKNSIFITEVDFVLKKQPKVNLSYHALASELERKGLPQPTPEQVAETVIEIRKSKLPDPQLIGNAGSFFKNPIVSEFTFKKLLRKYPQMPYFDTEEGIKIPAAWLIEKAGWKGYRKEDYGVHEKQALVLVNYGNATGQQIFDLANQIENSVKNQFEIEIVKEVNIVS